MNTSSASPSVRAVASPGAALHTKDLRLAGGIVVPAIAILAVVALLEFGLPSLLASTPEKLRLNGAWLMSCTIALVTVPALVAVALGLGDAHRGGELLMATLPVAAGARWRSKLRVIALVYAGFVAILLPSWMPAPAVVHALSLPKLSWIAAVSVLGVVWGFGAVGFVRATTSAYLLALILPVLALGALLVIWTGFGGICRSLLWTAIEFDPTLSADMTVRNIDGRFAADRLQYLAQGPLAISLFVSMLLSGLWAAWRARAVVEGRHRASRHPWRGIAGLAVLVAVLGVASTVVTTLAAQSRVGFDVAWNRLLKAGFSRAMAMSPEQLTRASVEVCRNWPCEDQLWTHSFVWSDRHVAPGGFLRTSEIFWQPYSGFADPDWHARQGMTIALRTRLLTETDRAAMFAAIQRAAADAATLNFSQRLDLAVLADEFGSETALVALAARALIDQRDGCEVLRAMEALALRGGEARGYSIAPCECRVRAYERLRRVRGEMQTGAAGAPWAGALELDSVDRALAVLGAPMSFLREPLDEALARCMARSVNERGRFPEYRRNMLECLDCDISTLIDAEGRRRE